MLLYDGRYFQNDGMVKEGGQELNILHSQSSSTSRTYDSSEMQSKFVDKPQRCN